MGSPEGDDLRFSDEWPQHEVTIRRFLLGKYPVTYKEYDAFCRAKDRDLPQGPVWRRGSKPVTFVFVGRRSGILPMGYLN